MAGELFFQYLQQLMARQDSPDLADMLEVYSLCLLLGFKGRYSATHGGDMQVLIRQLAEKIDRIARPAGRALAALAPVARATSRKRRDRWVPRLAIAAAVLVGHRRSDCSSYCTVSLRSGTAEMQNGNGAPFTLSSASMPSLEQHEAIDEDLAHRARRVRRLYRWSAVIVVLAAQGARRAACGCDHRRLAVLGLHQRRHSALVLARHAAQRRRRHARERHRRDARRGARAARDVEARAARSRTFGALPVLLVVGPEASTKTTTVVRSGLDPELLAGDVFRGETVAPTTGVNLWYRAKHGRRRSRRSAPRTTRRRGSDCMRALRPRSLRSALTGRAAVAAPRARLLRLRRVLQTGQRRNRSRRGARDSRRGSAKRRKQFGVQLPTYVVFTKLDAVPHFDAYTRNLSADEAREPLGAARASGRRAARARTPIA